jgi:hypothetical protein
MKVGHDDGIVVVGGGGGGGGCLCSVTQYVHSHVPCGGDDSAGEQHAQCQQVEQPSHTSIGLSAGDS